MSETSKMSGITPILLALLIAAIAVAFFQIQRNSKLVSAVSDAEANAEEKRADAEKKNGNCLGELTSNYRKPLVVIQVQISHILRSSSKTRSSELK